jgi:hypothetical protein
MIISQGIFNFHLGLKFPCIFLIDKYVAERETGAKLSQFVSSTELAIN